MENKKKVKQEEFIVTARKWRPLRFDFVVGQNHITHTLQNAIKSNRMHHAFLFSGPRGVGKTTTARILARALNCLNLKDFEPCNECENCTSILDGNSYDVIEIDGASNNSVDDVRMLRENSKYPPVKGKYKLYIIDEVHMLSTSAFNALLKTLEEPPQHLLFVFATTESHKVPATIISRCQRFDFRRMEIESIVNQLKFISQNENIEIDEESLITIAKKGDGSMRDSQSIFDQVIAFCGKKVVYSEMAESLHLIDEEFYFRISNAVLNKDMPEMFKISKIVISKGYDLQETLQGLLEHFRNILTVKVTNSTDLIDSSATFLERYKSVAQKFSQANILRISNIVNQAEQQLKYAPQPRIKFELTLANLATVENVETLTDILALLKSVKDSGTNFTLPERNVYHITEQSEFPQIANPNPLLDNVKISNSQISEKTESNQTESKTEELNETNLLKFFNELNVADPGLGFLRTSKFTIQQKKLNIMIEESFLYEQAQLRIEFVLYNMESFFGFRPLLNFEYIEIKSKNISIKNNSSNNLNQQNSSFRPQTIKEINTVGINPVEKAIIELFGAEQLID